MKRQTEIPMRDVNTPESFQAFALQERAKDAQACRARNELQNTDINPHLSAKDQRILERDRKQEDQRYSKEILGSASGIYQAALQVPDYTLGRSTLSAAGAAAVIGSGLIPDDMLPVNKEEALALLQRGGSEAQNFATEFSNRMNNRKTLNTALRNLNIKTQLTDGACEAIGAVAPPPSPLKTPGLGRGQSH